MYVINYTTGDTLASNTRLTGTHSGLVQLPTGTPDIGIEVVRGGFLDWSVSYPTDAFSIERNLLTAPLCDYDKQVEMVNLTLKLIQKSEAILSASKGSTGSTLNITSNTSSNSESASEENQDQILNVLLQNLRKVSAIRETEK